ncbi:hypothetical protein COLO4_09619 [Corchorus olitorius]|uniref:FBD domain-containing protein n=1 Tax=Corchorus olitorius TaxID=93759 RepID=A0A1R3KBN4_9ROSI|nr:hypothetical protein COLO4_09619 [Corchorus olitorius]
MGKRTRTKTVSNSNVALDDKICTRPDEEKDNVAVDRISSLPHEILCHIISFLPLVEAVRKCLLLKIFIPIFTYFSNLNFDDSSKKNSFHAESFMAFVETVLYRQERLNKLRISCHKSVNAHRLNLWIRHALYRKLKELDLVIDYKSKDFDLRATQGIFTCESLVALKLDLMYTKDFVLKVPNKIRLPNLKILHLKRIKFCSDDDLNRRLICSCSALEELVIEGCRFDNGCKFIISNDTLKRLTISYLNCFKGDHTIAIDARSLVYFDCGCIPKTFIPINLKSIVEAHVELLCCYDSSSGSSVIHSEAAIELFKGISEVQSLHLSGSFGTDFPNFIKQFPVLRKLTSLRVDAEFYIGWENILPDFLYCFPSVKSLAIKVNLSKMIDHIDDLPIPDKFPFYLSNQLKTVAFSSFEAGNKMQLQMVEYFLKYAKVLERLTVETRSRSMRPKSSLRRQFSKLSKVSKDCKVLVF